MYFGPNPVASTTNCCIRLFGSFIVFLFNVFVDKAQKVEMEKREKERKDRTKV